MEYELKIMMIGRATGRTIISLKGHITTHDIGVTATEEALHCAATKSEAALKIPFNTQHALEIVLSPSLSRTHGDVPIYFLWSMFTSFCNPDALDAPS
jgi:hypothetical protein